MFPGNCRPGEFFPAYGIAKGLLKVTGDLCCLTEALQDGCKADVAVPVKEKPVESVSLETIRGFWRIKAGMDIPLKSEKSSGASVRIS